MVRLVVVGAGGLVGRRVVRVLGEDPIPDLKLYLTGYSESIGKKVEFRGESCRLPARI